MIENESLWKEIFNGNNIAVPGDEFNSVLEFVKKTKYQLFSFNGLIFHVNETKMPFTVSDLVGK